MNKYILSLIVFCVFSINKSTAKDANLESEIYLEVIKNGNLIVSFLYFPKEHGDTIIESVTTFINSDNIKISQNSHINNDVYKSYSVVSTSFNTEIEPLIYFSLKYVYKNEDINGAIPRSITIPFSKIKRISGCESNFVVECMID